MTSYVSILWHMHQPFYRNPVGGEYRMPWTFLHAAKDYYDMLRLAVDEGARVTFNLVPSLIDQLQDYADPAIADTFLDGLRAPPGDLDEARRTDLVPRLFFAHLENQVRPLPRYLELHEKAQVVRNRPGWQLSDPDLLDLEVLFLLAWCGEVVRTEIPLVAELLGRGRDYRQEDKLGLLAELHALCGRTVDAYAEAASAGAVELSTTPYYHPILPLLLDMGSAREALPRATLPVIQRGFGEDAADHVRTALERFRDLFGALPRGFWPSEGSVSTATLELLARHGLTWAASDEDVLAATLGRALTGSARGELYRPHRFETDDGRALWMFFRDKTLADLIGFSYASWDAQSAARDFVGRLRRIAHDHGPDATISVILDGENAWEFYPNNGATFLRSLYREIGAAPDLEFATFSERLAGDRKLHRIHAGSWIYSSFGTWVGHSEKNRAWELLERTRCALEDHAPDLEPERRQLAWREIRIAEGSDWFWWLGDDHYSPIAGEFDQLFRLHLQNVYRLLALETPADLHLPIKTGGREGLLSEPTGRLAPRLDGAASSYFEWLGAGLFDLGYDAGAMHRTDRALTRLRFGEDGEHLFLCVEAGGGWAPLRGRGLSVEVEAMGTRTLRVRLSLDDGGMQVLVGDPNTPVPWAVDTVLELGIPLAVLEVGESREVYLTLKLVQADEVLERAPLYHMARLRVPADHALETWTA